MTITEFADHLRRSLSQTAAHPDTPLEGLPIIGPLDTAYRLPASGGLNTTRFTVQLAGETFVVEVWARGG